LIQAKIMIISMQTLIRAKDTIAKLIYPKCSAPYKRNEKNIDEKSIITLMRVR